MTFNRSFLLAPLTLAALLCCAGNSGGHPTFQYRGSFEREVIRIELPKPGETRGRVYFADDEASEAQFCEASAPYVCILSRRYSIAIPKNIGPETTSWSYRDVRYEILKRGISIEIAGTQYSDLFLIRSPAVEKLKKPSTVTLYSRRAGVIAFSQEDTGEGALPAAFWTVSSSGFGALK